MMSIDAQIEAVLFFKAEPTKIAKLATLFNVEEEMILEGLKILGEKLSDRGIVLLQKDGEVSLGTAPEMGGVIDTLAKEELSQDLGKASLETLTIVLYKHPIAKSEIDHIRGVNSNFILRHLLVRGLVEKIENPRDQRSFLYRPTFELLEHLGIKDLDELPDREEFYTKVEESITDLANKNEPV